MATMGSITNASDEIFDFVCSPCSKKDRNNEAVKHCADCHEYLCVTCVEHHNKFSILARHTLLGRAQFGTTSKADSKDLPSVPTKRCKVHTMELVDMNCVDHNTVGCPVCFTINQKDHGFRRHNRLDDIEQNNLEEGTREGNKRTFVVDHLATYTSKSGTTHPEDGLTKFIQDESSNGIRKMRCMLTVDCRYIVIIDNRNGDELERFSISHVHEPTAVLQYDTQETYNNLIIFTIADDSRHRTSPSDMYIFKCVDAQAQEIVDEILAATGKGGGRLGNSERRIPPPPSGPAPDPSYGKCQNSCIRETTRYEYDEPPLEVHRQELRHDDPPRIAETGIFNDVLYMRTTDEQNKFEVGMREENKPIFIVDHLATYTSESGMVHPEDGIIQLKQLELSTGIWTMRCMLTVDRRYIAIFDKATGDELEKFPLSHVYEPIAVLKNDRRETYNNLVLFTTADDPGYKNSPSNLHIFQAVDAKAQDIVDEILAAKGAGVGRPGPFEKYILLPASGPAPEPLYVNSQNVRETTRYEYDEPPLEARLQELRLNEPPRLAETCRFNDGRGGYGQSRFSDLSDCRASNTHREDMDMGHNNALKRDVVREMIEGTFIGESRSRFGAEINQHLDGLEQSTIAAELDENYNKLDPIFEEEYDALDNFKKHMAGIETRKNPFQHYCVLSVIKSNFVQVDLRFN